MQQLNILARLKPLLDLQACGSSFSVYKYLGGHCDPPEVLPEILK
jgi:hypothetical protein